MTTDIITDHEQEFANFEAQRAERFLERARKGSTILDLQGSGINNDCWVAGAPGAVDPDSSPDISPANAARGKGTGDELSDILSQLDRLQKLIGSVLNSYVEKAKVNRQGSTKPVPFPEKNAGAHNPFAAKSDQLLLDGEHQLRVQSKLAQLVAEHRRASSR
jgi:hypothetical protein